MEFFADSMLFEAIERNTARYLGQIINYMNAYIKGCSKAYIIQELNENRNISLNDYKYKESHNKVERIDLIAKNNSVDTEYFSTDLLSIINNLTEIERNFIFLRYQKQYELFEISRILNLQLEELEQLNVSILNQLRNMEKVKRLIK